MVDSKILDQLVDGAVLLADSAYEGLPHILSAQSAKAKARLGEFVDQRSKIEHVFARMKQEFGILTTTWQAPGSYRVQGLVMIACCIMYNVLHKLGRYS